MKKIDMRGIIVPILTPMNEDESVNEGELRSQVRRMIDAGIHGIFAFGTNGEGYALSDAEKERVLTAVVDEVRGRVPVYAGTGCITTTDTVRLSRRAQELGADALSIVAPFYAAASQDELYDHYMAVAEAVDLPIVLYNIPMRTGNALEPATVARLSEVDNIVGAKDSSGDWENLKAYIDLTRDKDFAVLSGNDSLILKALQYGAKGSIAGCANVYPKNMVDIYENFMRGDLEAAQACQDAVANFRSVFKYGNPNTVVKIAVEELGFPVALKGMAASVLHKTEAGIVALDVHSFEELRGALKTVRKNLEEHAGEGGVQGFLVSEMVRGGFECIVGVKRDPVFGPMIAVGLGGIYVEVLSDVSLRHGAVDEEEALDMIRQLKGHSFLSGTRGSKSRDVRALARIVSRVSRLAVAETELLELDINPVFVLEEGKGAVAADALVVKA